MIKAFLCDEGSLLSADSNELNSFLKHIQNHDLAFVLLTNPDESFVTIQARLAQYPLLLNVQFTFVTHHENSHFERETPTFFAEILARVGIEPNEALVVSDSSSDMLAGQQVGINGFHLSTIAPSHPAYFGTWTNFIEVLNQEDWATCFTPIPLAPAMIAPQLIGNMGAMRGLLHNIKAEFWHQHPDPNEWSPYQIVCHLLESEQTVQRGRLEKILKQDNPFLSQNTVAPTPQCNFPEETIANLFYQERHQTLNWLNSLPFGVWERVARHSIFGPTTFLEMAHFTAQHDRLHLNQLCQTLQKCH